MKKYVHKIIIILLVLMFVPRFVQAKEPVSHSLHSILFEVVEDGVVSSKRISMDIDAYSKQQGQIWAEARVAIFTINREKRHTELDLHYSSTDQLTIRDIKMDASVLSFEMIPFSLAPDRPIRLVATQDKAGNKYQVSGVAVWPDLFTKKPIKIEWRQINSISLTYPIVGQ